LKIYSYAQINPYNKAGIFALTVGCMHVKV